MIFLIPLAWSQDTELPTAAPEFMGLILPLLILIFFFYFVVIRRRYEGTRIVDMITVTLSMGIYVFLTILIIAVMPLLILLFLLYASVVIFIAYRIYRTEKNLISDSRITYNKTYPFRVFGFYISDFQHIYYHNVDLLSVILSTAINNLHERAGMPYLKKIEVADIDSKLPSPDKRIFYVSSREPTVRGSTTTLVVHLDIDPLIGKPIFVVHV